MVTGTVIYVGDDGTMKVKILPLTEQAKRAFALTKIKDKVGSLANSISAVLTTWSDSTDKVKANALKPGTTALKSNVAFILSGAVGADDDGPLLAKSPSSFGVQVMLPDNNKTMGQRKRAETRNKQRRLQEVLGESDLKLDRVDTSVISRNSVDCTEDLLVALSNTAAIASTIVIFDSTSIDPACIPFGPYGKQYCSP